LIIIAVVSETVQTVDIWEEKLTDNLEFADAARARVASTV